MIVCIKEMHMGLTPGSPNHLLLSTVCRFSLLSTLAANEGITQKYVNISVEQPSELLCISPDFNIITDCLTAVLSS